MPFRFPDASFIRMCATEFMGRFPLTLIYRHGELASSLSSDAVTAQLASVELRMFENAGYPGIAVFVACRGGVQEAVDFGLWLHRDRIESFTQRGR